MIYLDYFHKEVKYLLILLELYLPLVLKFLLRKAEPQRASGFMSMLPSSITNLFSNDEKKIYNYSGNVSEEEVIDQISRECCNKDRGKGKMVYQQAIKVLKENTIKEKQEGQTT